MRRYFIRFSYLGGKYRGVQKNIVTDTNVMLHDTDTIQGALESAFTTLIPKCTVNPKVYSSSRTDVGVHALCASAHVDLENRYDCFYNPEVVLSHINRYMMKCNHDIRLLEFVPMKPGFHCRKLVKSRTYLYRFLQPKEENEHRIPIVERLHSFRLSRSNTFDVERLKSATKLFMGEKNFQTFSAKKESYTPINFVRSLNSLTVEEGQPFMPLDPLSQNFNFWNIVCSAKSFLYNQVRRIVGALLALATGRITERDITIMLQVPGHHNWDHRIKPVPGYGLYLTNVEYCQEELDEYKVKYKTLPDSNIIVPIDADEVDTNEVDKREAQERLN